MYWGVSVAAGKVWVSASEGLFCRRTRQAGAPPEVTAWTYKEVPSPIIQGEGKAWTPRREPRAGHAAGGDN